MIKRTQTKVVALIFMFGSLLLSCSTQPIEMVSTTESESWKKVENIQVAASGEKPDVRIETSDVAQSIDGFGTCFNELGWTSLELLGEEDREFILKEMFAPGVGANFNICRMPVAANDFARKWYSYDETADDFEMNNFSISNDLETLVPFIKSALNYNQNIKIWASPWSPPSWMKYNKHYAARSVLGDMNFKSDEYGMDMTGINNGLPRDRQGKEGTDMFIQDEKYFKAYALYFQKFIKAYKEQGIDIFMVMPQNEFNSAQVFPSCTWTASGLTTFVGKYLGPAMKDLDVEVMFGTMERPNELLVDTVLNDPDAGQYVKGVGFQWAGKEAVPGIHKRYPELKLYQTEQECGNGKNDWKNCKYSWTLTKHYLENGAGAYMYWNTSLLKKGISTWGWKQNSLVSVDAENSTYQFNYEYYLIKHFSHFIQPGAHRLNITGTFSNLLAFINPDQSIILVMQNEESNVKEISVKIDDRNYRLTLEPDSFSSVKIL